MIQFNLLPNVKQDFIKARRAKRFVLLIAMGASGIALGVLIMLFLAVNVLQRQHLSNLNKDIERDSETLESREDINKILTVQNQLKSLPALHDAKPATTRLGPYLQQIVPSKVSVAKMDIDFSLNTLTFSGSADSLETVNRFVDTLKFTESEADGNKTPAFAEVVLSSFSRADQGANYQINLKFDPAIFDHNKQVALVVPSIISSRSETEKPAEELFQPLEGVDE